MQDLPGKGLGLRCVSRQFRLFPDFSVILFSVHPSLLPVPKAVAPFLQKTETQNDSPH